MNALLAYRYGGTRAGRRVGGVIYASSASLAQARLRRMNVAGGRVRLAWSRSLASIARPVIDPLDLESLYTYLARVYEKGLARAQLLSDAIEFVQDERLRHAIGAVRDAVQEGGALAKAMHDAGFPERDCRLIGAGEQSGRVPQVLASLAREVRRDADLRRALRRLALSPAMVAAAAYVLTYLALVVLAPPMARKFADNAQLVALPDYARAYYGFVEFFNLHLGFASVLYAAAGLLPVLACRSAGARAVFESALPSLRRIFELSEMAQLWGAFSMMVDSGINKYQIAQALARAAARRSTRDRFVRLERQLRLGIEIERAVERAGFSRPVCAGVRAAAASGALADGTRDLAERLCVQAAILTARAQTAATAVSALFGALFVLGFAALTVLPQLTSVLGSF